jgi:chemotaxis methyl-accepting protein methylase
MRKPALQLVRFRHVVFPGPGSRHKKGINFAPSAPPTAATEGRPSEPRLPSEHASFLEWLFSLAGLDVRRYRSESLRRRLPACLRDLRVRTVEQARALLEREPALVAKATSAMLVGVTAFFRDPTVFEALRERVLPALLQGRKGLRVWSAGCSDGAELYSVGILFAEHSCLASSYLLGTDCRSDAIHHARAGVYEPALCKQVPVPLRTRYFTPEGSRWRVTASLRAALGWRTADLLKEQEPGLWDLILCRNTAMYLRAEATSGLWGKFEQALRPGGVLVLGKAERPLGAKRLSLLAPCIYRRNRG